MNHKERIRLSKKSLFGTSIGDAFGDSFFGSTEKIKEHIRQRTMPETRWEFTDDTVMSIAIFEQLENNKGNINQDQLASQFVLNHDKDPNRGYGATARRILREIGEGADWRIVARSVFDGMGSMGNGGAMRAAPIGAYHHDNMDLVKTLAEQSAVVTHSNIEGVVGAVAVAIATAIATRSKIGHIEISPSDFIQEIVFHLPDCDTKFKIKKADSIPSTYRVETVTSILGNGGKMLAQDTVPFAIWCAAHHLDDFESAMWKAVSALGDRDTICAIVGGISIMSAPESSVPNHWKESVEDIDQSEFRNTHEKI